MAKRLRLVHTAQVHVARFDALRDAIAPDVTLIHVVRADLLDRARQAGVTDLLAAELISELGDGRTICTCTTFGPVAEAAGAIRIDRPMIDTAAQLGGTVLLVVVLESTVDACHAALTQSIGKAGTDTKVEVLLIPEVWHLFEAGDNAAFAEEIAERVNDRLSDHSGVVLAQVSMTDAAALIRHETVLTAPELALRFALSP